MLAMAFALALALAFAADAPPPSLRASYADDVAVAGLRPARDVKRALRGANASLAACVTGEGMITVEIDVLAAGFVDRVQLLDETSAFDGACLKEALQKLPLPDRGKEPATHAVVRFVAASADAAKGTAPADVANAVDAERDDFARCVDVARRQGDKTLAGTAVAHLVVRADGTVARADVDGGTLPSAAARDCIARVFTSTRFPGGREHGVEARVTIPLAFEKPMPPSSSSSPTGTGTAASNSPQQQRSPLEAPTLFQVLGCASPLP